MESSTIESLTATFLALGKAANYPKVPVDRAGFLNVAAGQEYWQKFAERHDEFVLRRVIAHTEAMYAEQCK